MSSLNYLQMFAAQNQAEDLAEKVNSSIAEQDEATGSYINSEEIKTTLFEQKGTEEVSSVHADEALFSGEVKTATMDRTVHFDSLESMAFTKPISFSYFGDTRAESSWKELYVDPKTQHLHPRASYNLREPFYFANYGCTRCSALGQGSAIPRLWVNNLRMVCNDLIYQQERDTSHHRRAEYYI